MSLGLSSVWPFPVPEDDPTFLPPELLAPPLPQAGMDGLPAPPVYEPPDLLSAPPPGFRERLAMALSNAPAYQPGAGTSGGQAFLGGLLSGGARGFASGTLGASKVAAENRERTNTVKKAEADRNWANAQATWRARLTDHYRTKADERGKILVTKAMAQEMGAPGAAGTYRDPVEIGTKIRERQNVAHVPAELAETMGKPVGAEATTGDIISARSLLKPNQFMAGGFDAKEVASGIGDGSLPAEPAGYSRGQWGAIATELHKNGVDASKLTLNYRALRQQITSMNQNQLLSYRGAIMKATPTLDYTESLVNELETVVPTGMFKEFTRAQLAAITRGGYGEKAANLATQIIGQINGPLNGEMATVYSRGGVPTDEARRGVQRQINENMGTSNLRAAFTAMRRDLNFAQTAMDEAGAWSPWNPTPGGVTRQFDLGPRSIPGDRPRTFIPDGGQ